MKRDEWNPCADRWEGEHIYNVIREARRERSEAVGQMLGAAGDGVGRGARVGGRALGELFARIGARLGWNRRTVATLAEVGSVILAAAIGIAFLIREDVKPSPVEHRFIGTPPAASNAEPVRDLTY